MMFTLEQLQAISDWQRGYNAAQKVKRIAAVRLAASTMDAEFRHVDHPCYRQLALQPKYVMGMGLGYTLDETVSSWTLREDIAENFKGGVNPKGDLVLPVILRVLPDDSQVVLNISALYANAKFLNGVDQYEKQISRFWDGIGRYRDSQAEVILALPKVYMHEVHSTGGHSSTPTELLKRPEVLAELDRMDRHGRRVVEEAIAQGKGPFGPMWLKGVRKDRILRKWIENAARLSVRQP